MDYLEQAKILYRKRHQHASVLSSNDIATLSLSITKLIRTCLTQHGGSASFKYLPFIHVIQRTVSNNSFQGDRAAMAFTTLEKYLLLLLAQPWKREYWLLKTYGGFFCTRVKAHLDSPEDILQLVGYMKKGESSTSSCLVLDHPPDTEMVLGVAFDCQVAVEECLYIGEYYEKMRCVGLSLMDAMNVLLSGASSDPVTGSPMVTFQGKSNNNIVGVHSELVRQSIGKGAPADVMQTVSAVGRGGMMGTNSKHQDTGVPATHPVAGLHLPPPAQSFMPLSQPSQLPYPYAADPPGVGLKVDVPQLCPTVGMGDAGLRQMQGSRAMHASSASGQSSGYGSGSASVLSAPSSAYAAQSAFTTSSGYNSSYHPPHPQVPAYNYGYPVAPHAGDEVDAPSTTAQLPSSVSPRHSRQLPLPPRPPADFPYIDEDDPSPVIPEATHEEHLQESLRNLQEGQGRSRGDPVLPVSTEMMRHQGGGSREEVAVSYDDWRWLQKDPRSGGMPAHNTIAGTRGMVAHPSTMIQRPSQYTSDMIRPPPSQPATAVTALLNTVPPMNGNQHRMQAGEYPPLTVVGTATSTGTHEKQGNSTSSVSGKMQDSSAQRFGVNQSQTVFYPPNSNSTPYQRHSNTVTGSAVQGQKVPTFAQMAASGRPKDNPALLSRQAQGSSTVVLGNLDKSQIGKSVINTGREGSGTSSEVILREKILPKAGPTRGSSLVTPLGVGHNQGQGFSRQSSQSMDLGMLKWRCRTCTMENSAVETICSACSKSKDAPELQFPAAGESKRICPACTYENQPGCTACEMCSHVLTDVHTYV